MNDPRPDVVEYMLGIAVAVSRRGECQHRQVGAVVFRDGEVVKTGYNGTVTGAPNCFSGACPRGLLRPGEYTQDVGYANCISLHAEKNAIIRTPVHLRKGASLAITHEPCGDCQVLMRAVGIVNAFYPGGIWYD